MNRYKIPNFARSFGAQSGVLLADDSGYITPLTTADEQALVDAGATVDGTSGKAAQPVVAQT